MITLTDTFYLTLQLPGYIPMNKSTIIVYNWDNTVL